MRPVSTLLIVLVLVAATPARAQVAELFAGQQRATADTMYFRFFDVPPREGEAPGRSDFLLFFRARAGVDYRMTATEYLPQFGLTGALSYNPAALAGFAPVLVGQVFDDGPVAKAGVQFVRISGATTFFSWLVSELRGAPSLDLFALVRHVIALQGPWGLFLQGEALGTASTAGAPLQLVERFRFGVQLHRLQAGVGLDLVQVLQAAPVLGWNAGPFVRAEF